MAPRSIRSAIRLALIVLIGVVILFGGYYYSDRYLHRGDQSPIERDIEHLEAAVRAHPQDTEARVALADYYLGVGMNQEAFELADQVLRIYPDNEGGLLIFGIAAARLEQPAKALEPLQKFIALRSTQSMAGTDMALQAGYYFLGESYLKLDRPTEAISALEAALAINAVDADALYQLGLAYQANGQNNQALEAYHKAIRLVPDFTEVYAGMIDSYAALDLTHHVDYARGMVAFSMQDYESAHTHLTQATQTLPDFSPAFLGLALTYEALGQPADALTAIGHALELSPDDIAARQALGRIQASLSVAED